MENKKRRKNGFYWIKYNQKSKWEIARWDSFFKKFRLTDGGLIYAESIYMIDEKQILKDKT